jgi:hypothetical protein
VEIVPRLNTSFEQRVKNVLPRESPLWRLLRRFKMDLNELLWAVKPGWPQIGESPEIGQLRNLAKDSSPLQPAAGGHRVLIVSLRSWTIHKMWEGLIARALMERGASPTVVICDGLPRCDMFKLDMPGYSAVHCRACLSYTRQVFHLLGLPVLPTSTFWRSSDRNQAQELAASWTGACETFEAEGLPLGELVRPSLMRTLLRGSLDQDPLSNRLYREYIEGGILLARMYRRALAAPPPDILMLLNGMFFAERIGLAVAKERRIHTVTHERGFMRNHLVLAHDEPANWFRVDRAWPDAKDRPLTSEEETALDAYLRSRQGGKNEVINYWPSIESRHEFIIEQLALDPQKPILTAFTNILWDTAVYQRDVAFDGMFHWLEHTIRQASLIPDLQLIIRIHPAEVRLRQKTRERVVERLAEQHPTLPQNVVIVPPESDISSYALTDLSTAVTVYTSTVGLESVLRGVPVLVAGHTHYRQKGFTHDVESPEHYAALLTKVPSWQPCPEEIVTLARRYASLFFLKNMIPFDLVTEFDDGSVELNIESLDDLKPGRFEVLDHLCAAILERKSFVLP